MPISKCRVRSTRLSCNTRIRGPAVAVATNVKEDQPVPRAYLLHESCQSTLLRDIPFNDEEHS